MKVIEVIESKRWKNTKTGQTASICGAVPYQGDQGHWIIETVGWTWRLDNGTVGLGRMPAKTRQGRVFRLQSGSLGPANNQGGVLI